RVEPARVVRRGELRTDVAQMPRLGDVSGGAGRAVLVPHDGSVLPGVLRHPGALLRSAELADLAACRAARDDIGREPRLVLAVPRPGRAGIRAVPAVRAHDGAVGDLLQMVRAVGVVDAD